MKKSGWTLLGCLLLLGAALYNGFPLVTSDSGMYIFSGFENFVPADRPIMYGLFIRHSSLAVSLWYTVIAQCLILSYVLWLTLRKYLAKGLDSLSGLLIIGFLCLFSGISWYAGQIMPDIFTPVGLLSLFLLLTGTPGRVHTFFVSVIFLLCGMVHNSNLLIFSLVILLVLPAGWLLKAFKNGLVKKLNYLLVTGLMVLCWVLPAALNYSITDKFELSGTPHAFLLAKNVENGMLDRYLDKVCGKALMTRQLPDSSLCLISPVNSRKMLDVNNAGMQDGELLHQWDYTGADNQQFYIVRADKNYYKIISKNSSKCLEADPKDTMSPGIKIVQGTYTGNARQQFSFQRQGETDHWNIISRENGKRLEIADLRMDNGAELREWDSTGAENQAFRIVTVPNCLCLFKDELPPSAINFLWNENNIFGKTGAWAHSKEEYDKAIHEIYFSPDFMGASAGQAAIATFRQLLRNDIGDGILGYDKTSSPYQAIEKHLKYEIKPFIIAKQFSWQLNFTEINKRHMWLLLFSLLTIVCFLGLKGLKSRIAPQLIFFTYLCFIAIVCNAFVTGAMANVLDRLECRIVWFIPLNALLFLFNHFVPLIRRKHIDPEH